MPTTEENEIIALEQQALDRWGRGDPAGFLQLYGEDVSYFDPSTDARLDGRQTLVEYYRPWTGAIHIARYEMVNPQVVVGADMALLTYNLVNYDRDMSGVESVGTRWNSTTVFLRENGSWRSIHSHWSFTRHPKLQDLTVASAEQPAQ